MTKTKRISKVKIWIKTRFIDGKYFFCNYFQEWIILFKALFKRFFCGFKKVDFILYFLFVILIVGGLGVFPSAIKYYKAVSSNMSLTGLKLVELEFAKSLSTYFITIIATSSADLILNKHPNELEARTLRMPAVSCLIIGAMSIFAIHSQILGNQTLNFAFYSTLFSFFIWWIANSMDIKYDKPSNNSEANFEPLGKEMFETIIPSKEEGNLDDLDGEYPDANGIKVIM
ncbi:hypothetical protein [Pedobacter gandavensis]|uniref:Uncharacterized protein n=1 Tax=Pedobacter gandavensis TaxID=2679963 RepID=A0ABR6EQ51_9SPHI|nr:hypothetical protein [Pedobacter gandavensis]MBB2147369.1 hypothetical protein [Pedobacter gandavensis]